MDKVAQMKDLRDKLNALRKDYIRALPAAKSADVIDYVDGIKAQTIAPNIPETIRLDDETEVRLDAGTPAHDEITEAVNNAKALLASAEGRKAAMSKVKSLTLTSFTLRTGKRVTAAARWEGKAKAKK